VLSQTGLCASGTSGSPPCTAVGGIHPGAGDLLEDASGAGTSGGGGVLGGLDSDAAAVPWKPGLASSQLQEAACRLGESVAGFVAEAPNGRYDLDLAQPGHGSVFKRLLSMRLQALDAREASQAAAQSLVEETKKGRKEKEKEK